jgi:hypothetical protein
MLNIATISQRNRAEILRRIQEDELNINMAIDDNTLLDCAAMHGDFEMIQTLLEKVQMQMRKMVLIKHH